MPMGVDKLPASTLIVLPGQLQASQQLTCAMARTHARWSKGNQHSSCSKDAPQSPAYEIEIRQKGSPALHWHECLALNGPSACTSVTPSMVADRRIGCLNQLRRYQGSQAGGSVSPVGQLPPSSCINLCTIKHIKGPHHVLLQVMACQQWQWLCPSGFFW